MNTPVQVPREYLNAVPSSVLERVVATQELSRSQAVLNTLALPECGRTAQHLSLLHETILGNEQSEDSHFLNRWHTEAVEVDGYYVTHEVLARDGEEWWAPAGLYAVVAFWVTHAATSETTTFVTVLRWDAQAGRWTVVYEAANDENAETAVTVFQTEAAPHSVTVHQLLNDTAHARSAMRSPLSRRTRPSDKPLG